MNRKTKIFVLHKREVLYTSIFIFLALVLIVLFLMMFMPDKPEIESSETTESSSTETDEGITSSSSNIYQPGIYSTNLEVSGSVMELQLIVEADGLSDVSLSYLDESIETMLPLFPTVINDISTQLRSGVPLAEITYEDQEQYTATMLLKAMEDTLSLALSE